MPDGVAAPGGEGVYEETALNTQQANGASNKGMTKNKRRIKKRTRNGVLDFNSVYLSHQQVNIFFTTNN